MNPLFEIIRQEAAQTGVLPFARFMELALYCPVHGYYEAKKDNPGRRGDFYTSVGTGELFGRLLACRFAAWLEPQAQLVEAGAHDGKLAADILAWLQLNRPERFAQIEYVIVEPSRRRQEWQRETLQRFAPRVRWFDSLQSLAAQSPRLSGVIFSNELLDAMPVRRFGWDAARRDWFEWGVAVDGGRFVWSRMAAPALPVSLRDLPASLRDVLPDQYTVETSPAAEHWWGEAAKLLFRGRLMTIDYGLTNDEWISPNHSRGTLRAYHRHHVSDDLLANVGGQDLTAHVNFSVLQAVGESAGLVTENFSTQAQFLVPILASAMKDGSLGGWNSAAARQFQTLTHPEHLGRAFRVLVQRR